MSVSDLKDCGHVGDLGGVGQWQGCAKQLCQRCVEDCAECGITLCPEHTVWLDGGQTPFCPECSVGHVRRKAGFVLLDRLLGRRGGGS